MQKYKVFINDKWIFFGEISENQTVENEEYDVLNGNDLLIHNFAEMIKSGTFNRNIALNFTENVKESFELFLSYFDVLEAAGGLVKHKNNTYLMIKRFGVWDFPKGKIEKGERSYEAALREVEEETGVRHLVIDQELPTTYHMYRYGRQWIVKITYWFLMKSDYQGVLVPQKEEDILEAIWVAHDKLGAYLKGTYGNLIDLVRQSGI